MIIWAQIALAVLQLVNLVMDRIGRDEAVRQGYDKALAEAAAAILSKTEYAKNVREKISAMDDKALDDALRDLEPK